MSNIRHQNTFLLEAKRWSYTSKILKHKVEAYIKNNELRKPGKLKRTNLFQTKVIRSSYTLLGLFSLFFVEKSASSLAWYKICYFAIACLARIWEQDSKESILPCHLVFPGGGKEFSSILKKTPCSSASILVITGSINASVPSNICYKETQEKAWSSEFCARFAEIDWTCYLLFYRQTYSR